MSVASGCVAVAYILLATAGLAFGHFDCDPVDCTCSHSQYGSYEIVCPKSSTLINLKVQFYPNVTLRALCTTTIQYEWLAGLRFGHVPTISFIGCTLPKSSFFELLMSLHITNTTKLIFQSNMNLSTNFQKHHLQGLDSIKTLVLSLNGLDTLPPGIFQNMTNLIALDLQGNSIYLQSYLFDSKLNLKTLELNMNNMSYIEPGSFQHLTKLQTLNVWGNQLRNLSRKMFNGLSHLMYLDLSENYISSLPADVFTDLTTLKNLSLTENSLSFLPKDLFTPTTHLEVVRLNNNPTLTHLPEGLLANLSSLREIFLQDCNISKLPENLIWRSSNIILLQLARNNIIDLPELLFKYTKSLHDLDMSNNKLTIIPGSLFSSLNQLHILHLDYNHISIITEDMLLGLKNLQQLHLNNNLLHHIDANAFRSTPNLVLLYLSHNFLSFCTTTDCDTLSPLQYCTNLEVLHLDDNALTKVFSDWRIINTRLQLLNLSRNSITYLEFQDLYFKSDRLTVDLTHNRISTVDLKNAETMVSGQDLSPVHNVNIKLNTNPIHCDCKIYDFIRYLEYSIDPEVHIAVNIEMENLTCASPNEMAGLSVDRLSSHTLTCHLSDFRSKEQCPKQCTCLFYPKNMILSINCSGIGLSQAPQELPDLHMMTSIELLLDHNSLCTLPETLPASYSKVSKLSLSYNNINHLKNVSLPQNLTVLEVDNNNLTHLDKPVVESFMRVQRVALHNNPWKCDCELHHLMNFLQSNPNQVVSPREVTCTRKYGAILTDLSKEDLCSPLHWEMVAAAGIAIALAATVLGLLAVLYLNYQRRVRTRFYICNR